MAPLHRPQAQQADLFRDPRSGLELKAEALGRFELRESNWIMRARQRMVELALESQREVCSDDVWRLCPPPVDVHPSVMGPVFRGGLFVRTGYRASTRPSAHARVISVYRLKE